MKQFLQFAAITVVFLLFHYKFPPDSRVAVIRGEAIRRSQLDMRLEKLAGQKTLDRMIEEVLVRQESERQKISVSQKEVDARIKELVDRLVKSGQIKSKKEFEDFVKKQSMTLSDVRDQLNTGMLLEKILRKQIKESEIKEYYSVYKERFLEPERVHAKHILVKSEPDARRLISRLKRGEKFEALAKQYSQDPGTKDKGGDLGIFARNTMVKEFEEAAFSMKAGEVKGPVKTSFGFHVIKLEEKTQGRVLSIDQARENIIQSMLQQKQSEFFNKLKKKETVKNYLYPEEEKAGKAVK